MSDEIYAKTAELRDRIQKVGTGQDAVLDSLLSAASRAIDGACNRPDGFVAIATATARYYAGSGRPWQRIGECVAVSEVAVKESATDDTYTVWTADTDYVYATGSAENPDFNRTPYTLLLVVPDGSYGTFTSGRFTTRGGFRPSSGVPYGTKTVKVTARWGYAATVPDNVKEACILQASRWFKRGESSWADTLANAEAGLLMFRKSLDPDLVMMLHEARLVVPAIGRR